MIIGVDIRTLMESRYSGVPEYTLNLLQTMLSLDKINKYILFYNARKNAKNYLPKFNQPNVWLVGRHWPNNLLNASHKFLNIPRIDKLIRQEVDLWWMPNLNFISLPKTGKSVLTVHDLSFLRYPEFFSIKNNIWLAGINIKKLAERVDYIIAISQNTKRDIIELCNLPDNKVSVIHSAISDKLRPVEEQDKLAKAKQKYGLPEKFILYLGTIEPRKNIESLILAYNQLRENNLYLYDYELIIAGNNGWKSKTVYKIAEESPYCNDIKFLGYIDEEDKASLYTLASLFVFPSFYEGFGFPPLESLACGTPVITSFISSLPEIIQDACILIDPYNIKQISLAMQEVLTNKELKNDLINNGIKKAKEYNWKKTATEYLNLFNDLEK